MEHWQQTFLREQPAELLRYGFDAAPANIDSFVGAVCIACVVLV